MRVLVTGAAGFIGSNLVYHLVEQRPSWDITALDLLTYAGNIENIAPLIDEKKIHFERVNIVDANKVAELFQERKFDLVIHLAAETHVDRSIHSASEFVLTNVVGTQNLLSAALETKVQRFIHISTDEVYGSAPAGESFVETTLLTPSSPYAASKASSDLLVLAFGHTHNYPVLVTRCSNNYGPFQFPEKLIPLFITNALKNEPLPLYGDGLNERNWLYVTDHCSAILALAEKGRMGEVYNIGAEKSDTIPNTEVTKKILSLLKKPETLIKKVGDRPGHDRRYCLDSSKLRNELGWKPLVGFDEGMKRTIEWYQQHQPWWEGIKSGAYLEYYRKQYGTAA